MNELFRRDSDLQIHQLTVEGPTEPTRLPFDPERDITDADWQNILQYIEERAGNIEEALPRITHALLLFPERRAELKLTTAIAESVRDTITQSARDTTDNGAFQVALLRIARARVVFPELMTYTDLFPAFKEGITRRLQATENNPVEWTTFGSILNRAFPAHAEAILAEYWPSISTSCRELEDAFIANPTPITLDSFQDILFRMRLTFPHHLDELQAPKGFWPLAHKALDYYRRATSEFLRHAVTYKGIVAKEVIVDERGVQFNLERHPDREASEKYTLPEQRKY